MNRFFSPGKLLLTSEYAVLDGALALAVPTKLGQEFFFNEVADGKKKIVWEAFHEHKPWLHIRINYDSWEILETNLPEAAQFIVKVLKNIQELSPIKFKGNDSYHLKTNLQFPANFGLGSSSTLMANLATWAEIDAFKLNEMSLGGSGYDIAVALEKSPLLYRLSIDERIVRPIKFEPPFKDKLIFIHLNNKQDSRKGIQQYRSKPYSTKLVENLSIITEEILRCSDVNEFSGLLEMHEKQLSTFLNMPTAKALHFSDCPTFIKSLGAWGGDFVMSGIFSGCQEYFSEKGFANVFSWDDLID